MDSLDPFKIQLLRSNYIASIHSSYRISQAHQFKGDTTVIAMVEREKPKEEATKGVVDGWKESKGELDTTKLILGSRSTTD